MSSLTYDREVMTSDNHHILIVDDQENICKVVCEALEQNSMNVTCFTNGQDCLKQLNTQRCDLLITDLKMPGIDGIELMTKAKSLIPWLPVIIITGYGDIPIAVTAMKGGAVDFIEKPLDTETLLQKVKSVLKQNHEINNLINKPLTQMEKKVLKLIVNGNSNREIALELKRSKRTIEVHRTNIMKKLGVNNVVDLIKRAVLVGLIKFPNNHINNDILDDK